MLTAHSSSLLHEQRVSHVAGVLIDFLLIHGMQPNLRPSKTEVFIDLRGPGSVECRRQIHNDGYILMTASKHMQQPLRIVGSYKHLGTWVQTNGKLGKEIKCRLGTAHKTMTQYKGAIFANRGMKLHKKVQLFQSLVLSAVLYNSPIWMLTRKQDIQKLHSGIMGLYRRVAVGHYGIEARTWPDEKIQAQLELPQPLDWLHVYRLRYAQHLVKAGDNVVWATLHQTTYWWELLDRSLHWLRLHTLRPLPTESCITHWHLWEPWLVGNGRPWRAMVRQAMIHSALQNRKESLWQDFHRMMCTMVTEEEAYEMPAMEKEIEAHACPVCRKVFPSCSAWSVHAFRKHGRRTPARLYARGNSCEICMKVFHDHMGLINHISNNPSCYWQYSSRGETVDPQPSLNSGVEIRSRTDLRCPVTYATGPAPEPIPITNPTPTPEQKALLEAWHEVLERFDSNTLEVAEVREQLRLATLTTYLPTYEILYVAKSLRLQLQQAGEVTVGFGIHRALTKFIDEYSVDWLLGDQERPKQELRDPQVALEYWQRLERKHRVAPKPLKYRQIIVAHLFSGRRREGDFQDWASKEQWKDDRYTTLAISVDIIFSIEWGDLANPRTYAWFVEAIKLRYLIAILAGPPCETWSVARERGLTEDHGPRPLRSRTSLSGFAGLTNRETKQLCVGNLLFLGVALTLATQLWLAGGICIVEHPSEPSLPHAPSIWRTEAMKFLLAHGENRRILVWQGFFGSRSPKPTEFLVTHAPGSAERIFSANQIRSDLPKEVSVGRNQDGQFKTASLKEYPSALSHSLWEVVVAHLQNRGFSAVPQNCPEDVLAKFGKLHALLDYDVQEMGPDYHPVQRN